MVALLAMASVFACLAFLPLLVAGLPQVNYPLNMQYPPVARVGTPFSFQFAPTTFSSASGGLQYSLIGNPPWLSLDDNSRTLSGTPRAKDVGTVNFTIAAAEQAGAVTNMQSQLLVIQGEAPTTKEDISASLSAAGEMSEPDTVILKPSKPFSISFPSDTFDAGGVALSYFALLSNRTPLPAWISFDSSSRTFAGTAPPSDYAQSFQINLIASEVPGCADSSLSFTIVVSNHTWLFKPFSQSINVVKGAEVRITGLKQKLLVDDSQAGDSDIQSATADLPPWLSFDNGTFEITGTAPSMLTSQNLTVTVKDLSGDVAEYTVHLVAQSELFASQIGTRNLTLGQPFEYKIPPAVLGKDDASVTVSLVSLAQYLHFDSATATISGTFPVDVPARDIQCSLTATSNGGTGKESQTFHIATAKTMTLGPNQGFDDGSNPKHRTDGRKTAIIVGAVIGAVCGAFLLLAFAVCLHRRHSFAKSYIRKSEISRPIPNHYLPYGWTDIDETPSQDEEKGKDTHNSIMARTPEHPLKIPDLDLPNHRRDSHSAADTIDDADSRVLDTFEMSSFGIHNDTAPSHHPPDSMKIPTELAKRASRNSSNSFRKHKRRTTTVYSDQIHRSTGLPVNRRITGAGHGRHTYSPSRTLTNASSMRRPLSTGSYATTRRTSTFSTTPSVLPQSPTVRKHMTPVTTPTEVRRSVRVVPASRRSSIADQRTTDEKRNSYIRKRASAQSPFFSAGTRVSSSGYKSPPAFITEVMSSPRCPLSPTNRNTIVRPDDDVVAGKEKEIPATLRIVWPSGSQPETPKRDFTGSLRTNRPQTAMSPPRDRIKKSYARPGTAISSGMGSFGRRASTRHTFRGYDLKAGLNRELDSKVFEDAEMSESAYSDEEPDIEEAEKHATIKPGQYAPLNLPGIDTPRNEKRASKTSQRKSKRNSKREIKRTSERDPTPYQFPSLQEHGGKENASSTYTLGQRSSPIRTDAKGKARALSSPERPKPSTARHSKLATEARKSHRASTHRTSKLPTRQPSTKERHSRKSIHSRTQSRHSGPGGPAVPPKKTRAHSRSQSSAFPFFDAKTIDSPDVATSKRPITTRPSEKTKTSLIRDLSGNLTFYDSDMREAPSDDDGEEHTLEELGSSSICFRTSGGYISPKARQSRLASLHLASSPPPPPFRSSPQPRPSYLASSPPPPPPPPPKSEKRTTVRRELRVERPLPTPPKTTTKVHTPTGSLGLFPRESIGDGKRSNERGRERTPLSALAIGGIGNAVTPEAEARKTWGALSLKGVLGRGGRWVSGGGGYWDRQKTEDRAFI